MRCGDVIIRVCKSQAEQLSFDSTTTFDRFHLYVMFLYEKCYQKLAAGIKRKTNLIFCITPQCHILCRILQRCGFTQVQFPVRDFASVILQRCKNLWKKLSENDPMSLTLHNSSASCTTRAYYKNENLHGDGSMPLQNVKISLMFILL